MPFKSKTQARYMFAKLPTVAKRWAKHTPSIKQLPNKLPKSYNGSGNLRKDK